ncbi:MAG: hypothetical protein Q8R53_00140 [Nanoarchaeota archaeon]|nr:hypothetical protein [Nanoarchaeota archaeon]
MAHYDCKSCYETSSQATYVKDDIPGRPPGCCLKGCCAFGRKFRGME